MLNDHFLPATIAAPTPVSSLVLSSTLLTAGLYLMIRFSSSFSRRFKTLIIYISVFTIFITGLNANFKFEF